MTSTKSVVATLRHLETVAVDLKAVGNIIAELELHDDTLARLAAAKGELESMRAEIISAKQELSVLKDTIAAFDRKVERAQARAVVATGSAEGQAS